MKDAKTRIANQIDCKITTGLLSMREKLSQPATLHLPSMAVDAVNAKVNAFGGHPETSPLGYP